ncbi:MAG: TlpA family protein disulfide reductase [Intrasporangiaceae bacterium]|nr:TlpA family protein disulfide reductase [Intrasporangiaceae bacterium]
MSTNTPKKQPNPRAEARRAAEKRRRLLLIGGGAAIVLLAVGIAVASVGESASRVTVDDVASDIEVSGEPLPAFAGDPTNDPAIGLTAPVVDGQGFDGEARQVGGASGPQLIAFMASWCPACGQEMPELTTWVDEERLPDGVDLVVVSTFLDEGQPNWPPDEWFDGFGYPGPVMVDDARSTASEAFGLSGTPFWVAVDADGEVVWRTSGLIPMELLDEVAALLAAG